MSDTPFHQTRMGHTFFDATMPAIARELARLNENLERLLALAERQVKSASPDTQQDADAESDR